MKINAIAVGINIFVKRDEAETERNDLLIPDQAQIKPNTGEILSVGKLVGDKSIQVGRKAVWNRYVGQDIELNGEIITALKDVEVIGVI